MNNARMADRSGTPEAWQAFAARCQKPNHDRLGSWMARRVARPLALRITWVVAPWGVSAHAMTLLAWASAMVAAAALGQGTLAGLCCGAGLLQLWYLLDHVDGQLARLRGEPSLDGAQLDYLMHHAVQLLVPCGVGWGLFARSSDTRWLLAGAAWGVFRLLAQLLDDTRFKAFEQRWKRVIGVLELHGGGGGRPAVHLAPVAGVWARLRWLAHKSCEMHVTMNGLTLIALTAVWSEAAAWRLLAVWTAITAAISGATFTAALANSLRQERAERSFAAWFRVPHGCTLAYRDGWWHVERPSAGETGEIGEDCSGAVAVSQPVVQHSEK